MVSAAPGIGIAAPHFAILKRLVVMGLSPAAGLQTYVNPAILWASAEMIRHTEGSVSMPGVTENIERHATRPRELSGSDMRNWLIICCELRAAVRSCASTQVEDDRARRRRLHERHRYPFLRPVRCARSPPQPSPNEMPRRRRRALETWQRADALHNMPHVHRGRRVRAHPAAIGSGSCAALLPIASTP
ncbi:peptide deformylase [Mesorhizobium alhagi CCNWXJ12-2]|uniref:Peptide deformylase n=1 Tax=Mesorhizobium alhagi CCNWXJ12-2 TaxID=1107882 RepID=H0HUK6_9HYPH|nr:peptide deformylase [Mesorhizobium alhagi CCNWXJ12-2]